MDSGPRRSALPDEPEDDEAGTARDDPAPALEERSGAEEEDGAARGARARPARGAGSILEVITLTALLLLLLLLLSPLLHSDDSSPSSSSAPRLLFALSFRSGALLAVAWPATAARFLGGAAIAERPLAPRADETLLGAELPLPFDGGPLLPPAACHVTEAASL